MVRLTWSEKSIGRNNVGDPLIRQDVHILVVDRETNEALGEPYIILGKEPAETTKKKASGTQRGPKPNDKVIDYIKNLPKK